MYLADGQVDHYLSKKNHPHLAYEWLNYRFIAGTVNAAKGNHDDAILDPFEVKPGWFEAILPSLQLVMTNAVPPSHRSRAEFTMQKLSLINGPKVRRTRRNWYEQYRQNKITIDGLQRFAPLVADAVIKWQSTGKALPVLSI